MNPVISEICPQLARVTLNDGARVSTTETKSLENGLDEKLDEEREKKDRQDRYKSQLEQFDHLVHCEEVLIERSKELKDFCDERKAHDQASRGIEIEIDAAEEDWAAKWPAAPVIDSDAIEKEYQDLAEAQKVCDELGASNDVEGQLRATTELCSRLEAINERTTSELLRQQEYNDSFLEYSQLVQGLYSKLDVLLEGAYLATEEFEPHLPKCSRAVDDYHYAILQLIILRNID